MFFSSKEPETPATPEVGKEFTFSSPPTTKFLDSLDVNAETFVTFYIRSSTTGQRGIVIKACYKILDQENTFNCHIDEKLNLETVEPFLVSSELLRYSRVHISSDTDFLKILNKPSIVQE